MTIRTRKPGMKAGIVTLASSLLVLTSVVASAQETDDEEENADASIEEVVVRGMRQSLETAQDIKRHAPTVVDSITAKDLGSFPDKSVAEALQRVAGITVNRFAASSDTAHFSAEPSGVVVRGLDQVRTEFNGRTSFSANSSRGLSWGDVSPELMSGVDTYKNQMAELIEGGIAGTVNMRTRVPFDQDGQMVALTVNANYGDLAEEVTPEVSGLYSNRWETGVGEFGFLANFAYSDVVTKTEGLQFYRANRFKGVYGGENEVHYIPANVNMRENVYNREREGMALAFQYQNPSETVVLTTQYNRSEYNNAWEEYVVGVGLADLSFSESVFFEIEPFTGAEARDNTLPQPAPGTGPFAFDDQNLFQSGTFNTGTGWWGGNSDEAALFASNAAGEPFVVPCYNNGDNGWDGVNACSPTLRGVDTTTTTRSNNNENMTQDLSFNVKWAVTDRIRTSFDIQYVDSEVNNYDIDMSFTTYSNPDVSMNGDAELWLGLTDPTNVNMSPGGFTNPNNYRIHYIMDHLEDSEGDQLAARADVEFDIDNGWLESVKTGIRFAERDQQVRWSSYNWQNVANGWTGNQAHYYNLDRHEPAPEGVGAQAGFTGYPEGFYEVREFGTSDFHNINVNQFVFADMELLQDQERMANSFGATALGLEGGVGWDPTCSNTGDRSGEIPGTCFTPAETVDLVETTEAFYVQFNFGGPDLQIGNIPVSGNVGVRYVGTEITSTGGIAYPRLGDEYFFDTVDTGEEDDFGNPVFERVPNGRTELGCEPRFTQEGGTPEIAFNNGCYLSEEDVAFMNGASPTSIANADHDNFLPSVNVKFDLTEELVLRFAGSVAMSRPDIGNLRNYVSFGGSLPSADNPSSPQWIRNDEGEVTGIDVFYSGGAQNPYLKPITATQFDLALEYYFAEVGSFTFTLFQKEFDDYIQFGAQNLEFTNNGVTRTAEIRRPINGEGAEINGFEIAYQQFFDMLPEPFDGLGVQANYTYINNEGITNTNVQSEGADGTTITGQAPDSVETGRLEGLSDHSFNLVGMYEKGDWQARLAYSWRDEYMVTAIDCCVAYPVWNEAYGALDGSIKYSVNDYLDITFQGSNLLNEETVTRQQVTNIDEGGLLLPTGRFQQDRRFTVGLRLVFQ